MHSVFIILLHSDIHDFSVTLLLPHWSFRPRHPVSYHEEVAKLILQIRQVSEFG